jgi:hypothetical protein
MLRSTRDFLSVQLSKRTAKLMGAHTCSHSYSFSIAVSQVPFRYRSTAVSKALMNARFWIRGTSLRETRQTFAQSAREQQLSARDVRTGNV